MASVMGKIRTAVLVTVHGVLDKVIDTNSVGAVEQHIRDLEKARDMLDDEAAGYRSDAKNLPLQIAALNEQTREASESVDELLGNADKSDDHHAAPFEAKIMALEEQVEVKKAALTNAQVEVTKYRDAVGKLDIKLASMRTRIENLRQLAQTKTANERASRLLANVSLSETPNIDDIEQRLRRQADVAVNARDRELTRITGSVADATLEATVAARLAKRRAALEAKKAAAVPDAAKS